MRSLSVAFTAEKNRSDARPFMSAVFHFGGSIGEVYISDRDISIGGNFHYGIAARFGEYRDLISPRDGVFQLGALRCEIINFPFFGMPKKRFSDLWSGLGVEGIEVDVYQNIIQGSQGTVLQDLLFAGVIRPISYTPKWAVFDIFSVSERYLDRADISFPIDQVDFPLADLDEIGERAHIAYGSINRVHAHAIQAGPSSILRASMDAIQLTVPIFDEFYDIAPSSGLIAIESELITYTGKSGSAGSRILTCARGPASVASIHPANAVIVPLLSQYIYLAHGMAMKQIRAVRVKRGENTYLLDASDYTADLANTTLISGKTLGLVKFTGPLTLAPKTFIGKPEIDSSGGNLGTYTQWSNGTLSANLKIVGSGGGQVHLSTLIVDFGGQQKIKSSGRFTYTVNWSVVSVSGSGGYTLKIKRHNSDVEQQLILKNSGNGADFDTGSTFIFIDEHWHEGDNSTQEFRIELTWIGGSTLNVEVKISPVKVEYLTNAGGESTVPQTANGTQNGYLTLAGTNASTPILYSALTVDFGTQQKAKASGRFKYTIPWSIVSFNGIGGYTLKIKRHNSDAEAQIQLKNQGNAADYTEISPFVFYDDHWHEGDTAAEELKIEFVLVGGAGLNAQCYIGQVEVEYLANNRIDNALSLSTTKLSPQSSAELLIGDEVLVDGDFMADDGSGTYTSTANALIEKPADCMHHLARAVLGIPSNRVDASSFQQARADAPSSYKFAALLGERSNAKEILLAMGIQARIKVDWPRDKLTARFLQTVYGAISKIINQENVMRDSLEIAHNQVEDLINVVNLYYGRDWSKSRGRDAFKKVSKATDSTSIAKYGRREVSDRFLFDFIEELNSAMADDLRDFWLARLKDPARLITIDVKLDQYELAPGDIVSLDFKTRLDYPQERFDGLDGTQKLLIEAISVRPGSLKENRGTRISFSLREVP